MAPASVPGSPRVGAVDVLATADPVAAVLRAHADGRAAAPVALRTSGTAGRPRLVVRTTASWWDSFPHVAALTGLGPRSRLWLPGPPAASMNLFAAVLAHWAAAQVVASPGAATHAHLTPAALHEALREGCLPAGCSVTVAGDRLPVALHDRAVAAGLRVSHYYGAAELSFVAWGSHAEDLRPFPEVEVEVREGEIWARSPYLCSGYAGDGGPLRRDARGFATVGDRGRFDGDRLVVAGRDDAVLVGGATVLVADVEAALRPVVRGDLVVLGVAHPRLGQVVAAVLTDPDDAVPARRRAAEALAPAQRPRVWHHLPALPLTDAGKVDRARLAAALPGAPRLVPGVQW